MPMHSNPLTLLSTGPTGSALGLDLPPGSLVAETYSGPWAEPLLWVADDTATPAAWARYAAASAGTGLRPVLLEPDTHVAEWWRGALDPALTSRPADHDAEAVLKGLWDDAALDHEDEEDDDGDEGGGGILAPYTGSWPGIAPSRPVSADADAVAAEVVGELSEHRFSGPRLALVPVARSADLPAAIGWAGPLNHENDTARLCAVLRSWEDRFGVRVVALSLDRLDLSVAAPPRTVEEALAVAAEHFAFCPDNVWQGYETLLTYAEEALVGNHHWTFWWD
ncbi:DUF4253 domain-containing protein [Streptomyces tritici]|uniref:DUF4253 domain-containing protein n=1 Tax=Streptomyces tritici TaxID=2054410 RepID=UPI003AF08017